MVHLPAVTLTRLLSDPHLRAVHEERDSHGRNEAKKVNNTRRQRRPVCGARTLLCILLCILLEAPAVAVVFDT